LAVNIQPKPTAAFALSVIAGLVTILGAFLLANSPLSLMANTAMASMVQIWGPIAGLLVIAGSWLLYSNAAQRKLGSTLVLVFSLVSMNVLGLILGLIGGFLGFTWKQSTAQTVSR